MELPEAWTPMAKYTITPRQISECKVQFPGRAPDSCDFRNSTGYPQSGDAGCYPTDPILDSLPVSPLSLHLDSSGLRMRFF